MTKFIPNVRTGGKLKRKAVNFIDKMDDDNIFNPTPNKKKSVKGSMNDEFNSWKKSFDNKSKSERKEGPKNESFNASFETWDSKDKGRDREKPTYMKRKRIVYDTIKAAGQLKQRKTVVKGPGASRGQYPQAITLTEVRLNDILRKNVYLDTEVIDAALSLIDRKLSEDAQYIEGVHVYYNTTLRLIMAGAKDLVKNGPFIAILPRSFAFEEEKEQAEALGRGELREDVSVGHFTLVSDIHCDKDEVRVYETLLAYRKKDSVLTKDQKKLLKILKNCQDKSLRVQCVNVVPQKEAECGAISVALAVKLCFTAEDEEAIFDSFVDVRRDLVATLRDNNLLNFESKRQTLVDLKQILFSIKI